MSHVRLVQGFSTGHCGHQEGHTRRFFLGGREETFAHDQYEKHTLRQNVRFYWWVRGAWVLSVSEQGGHEPLMVGKRWSSPAALKVFLTFLPCKRKLCQFLSNKNHKW